MMERRNFLMGGLAGTAWPLWNQESRGSVGESLARARTIGKPLLVLLVPGDQGLASQRSRLWGEYLYLAPAEDLARLALCEVVCAPHSEVPGAAAKALATLIETDREESHNIAEAGLGPIRLMGQDEAYEPRVQARAAELAKRLKHLIVPSPDALERRTAQCRASLTEIDRMTLAMTPGPRPRLAHKPTQASASSCSETAVAAGPSNGRSRHR